MHLLVLNQKLDPTDSGLEVAWEWVHELAARVARVTVITHERGSAPVPSNVRVFSLGKEKQFGRARRAREFYKALFTTLREDKIDACFVHMVPLFAVMAAPVLKLRGIRMVQWYTHAGVTVLLRAAVVVVDCVATASRESFSLRSPKVVITGHGIDTERFRPADRPETPGFHILSVGRLSPAKRHDLLLDAIVALRKRGKAVHLSIVGEPRGPDGVRCHEQLREQVSRQSLANEVSFVGPVARHELPSWYNRADVCVNLSETRSVDKAVLEAMSCGVPVVTSNPAFRHMLVDISPDLSIAHARPASIAAAIEKVIAFDAATRANVRQALRARVVRDHDLHTLMNRIIELLSGAHA